MSIHYKETPEFQKNFKKLSKRYKTLFEDLENFKKNLPVIDIVNNKNFAILIKQDELQIIKARLFCRSLRRNSLRIIYSYYPDNQNIEFFSVEFIELYFKGDQENEDRQKIKNYLNNR